MQFRAFWLIKYNIAVMLFCCYTGICQATLTSTQLEKIRTNPWVVLGLILSKTEILHKYEYEDFFDFNNSVQIIHLNPPCSFRYTCLNNKITSVDYVFFQQNLRSPSTVKDSRSIHSFFILYEYDGSFNILTHVKLSRESSFDVPEVMFHLAVATKSERMVSHSPLEIDQVTSERRLHDCSKPKKQINQDKNNERFEQMYTFINSMLFLSIASLFKNVPSVCDEHCAELMTPHLFPNIVPWNAEDKSQIFHLSPSLFLNVRHGMSLIYLGLHFKGEECLGSEMIMKQMSDIDIDIDIDVCGIDIDPTLINKAKTDYPTISFHAEDPVEAGRIIKKYTAPDSNKLVIVIAQDLLQNKVMTGTYPALKILQQLAESGRVSEFYVTTYEMPLFNRYMVESSGWNMKIFHIPHEKTHPKSGTSSYEDNDFVGNQLNLLTPMPVSDQVDFFIQQSNTRKKEPTKPFTTLDLSMSSNPKNIFSFMMASKSILIQSVKSVDLSWTLMSDKESTTRFLTDLHSAGIKNIIVSGFEPWFQEFEYYIKKSTFFNIYKRTDAQYASEVPAMTPKLVRILTPKSTMTKPYFIISNQSSAGSSSKDEQRTESFEEMASSQSEQVNHIIVDESDVELDQKMSISTSDAKALALKSVFANSFARNSVNQESSQQTDDVIFQVLDISSNVYVLDILKHFIDTGSKYSQTVKHIDLSNSNLTVDDIEASINLLLSYPALEQVTCNGKESWYSAFNSRLSSLKSRRIRVLTQLTERTDETSTSTPKLLTDTPSWSNEIDSGYLSTHLIPNYHRTLSQLFSTYSIQLIETPADGLCFFHAIGMQLNIPEYNLRSALVNHLLFNSHSIQTQFPQYAGDQFNGLLLELEQGSWGDAGQALLVASVYQRRVFLLYFHSESGGVQILQLNPDSSSEVLNVLPFDIDEQDIILTHNGLGHWIAGSISTQGNILQQHNLNLLAGDDSALLPTNRQEQQSQQHYSPSIFPQLIIILINMWSIKFGQ